MNYFAGWYLDNNFNTPIDSNYIVTDNITLYARWYKYVNLSLNKRVLSNPNNVSFSNNTNRIFNINTYVVGISADNYYITNFTTYNYNPPYFNVSVGIGATGYGIGIPIPITASKYYFNGTTKDVFSFSFYKNNGEFISYKFLNGGIFEVPASANIMLLNMRGNENIVPTTFSNPVLYIVE